MSGYHVDALLHVANLDLRGRGIWRVFSEAYHMGRISITRPAEILLNANTVTVLVGFPIPPSGIGETDGPLGALCLAIALESLGKYVRIIADKSVLKALREVWENTFSLSNASVSEKDVIISIEVPGRSKDGRYYSMRGALISPDPLDDIILKHVGSGRTVCIGDGGNEAGMGSLRDLIVKHVPLGDKIASSVPADHVITGGTSNWAAYALVGALSTLTFRNLLKEFNEQYYLRIMYDSGLIDGFLGRRSLSVDGIHEGTLKKVYNLMIDVVDRLIDG